MTRTARWALLIASGLVLAACGSSSSPTTTSTSTTTTTTLAPKVPASFKGKSAAQILTIVNAALATQSSVHVVESVTQGGTVVTQTVDVAANGGELTFTAGTGTARGTGEVLSSSKGLYFRDTGAMLKDQFGTADPSFNNVWIQIPSTNGNYSRFHTNLAYSNFSTHLLPLTPATIVGLTTYQGQNVFGVQGQPNPGTSGTTGYQIAYISLTAPYLPVAIVGVGTTKKVQTNFSLNLSRWQEVVPEVPTGRIVNIDSTPMSTET